MATRYYDEALYNKINKWIKDKRMRVYRPDESRELFEKAADMGKDIVKLPLIAIHKDTSFELLQTTKTIKSFNGYKIARTKVDGSERTQTAQLNAIPIQLAYQLDIYTKDYDSGDEYVRNFLFNLINYPKISIEIPYNGMNYKHNAYIRVLSTVTDNSDIPERLFPGQFTRWTIGLEIQGAYLFSIPFNKDWIISDDADGIEDEIVENPVPVSDSYLHNVLEVIDEKNRIIDEESYED